jgi:nucleoid DNA-binding protein/16S rRNA G966 N2-methylase RsmD
MNGKIDYLFSNFPKNIRNKLQFDDEALYSITENNTADIISKIILDLPNVTSKSTILDLTACVGGNTISFSKLFKKVNSVELDNERFKMLKNNIKLLDITNINTFNEDALNIIDKLDLKQDVIFLDPPWGGTNYKEEKNLHLFLGKVDVQDFIKFKLLDKSEWVIMKVPNNYAIDDLKKNIDKSKIYVLNLNKMKIILMTKNIKNNINISKLIKKINITYNIQSSNKMPKKASSTSGNLKKSDLHSSIAEKCGVSKVQVDSIMETLAEIAESELKKGNSISISGLVKLSSRKKSATKARPFVNPKTGEKTTISAQPARFVAKSTALKRMTDLF